MITDFFFFKQMYMHWVKKKEVGKKMHTPKFLLTELYTLLLLSFSITSTSAATTNVATVISAIDYPVMS